MAFDDNVFDTEIVTAVSNSGNTTTTNTANLGVDLDTVGNTDASTNDSGNLDVEVDDSFHSNSHNTEWDIEDSGNTGSYNDWLTVTDESVTDNSINAGVREYNTGFGDVELGGGGGGGDLWVNNQNTIVDTSSSNNILSGGGVFQHSANETVVASGDGALAAGDDIDVEQHLNGSTNITAGEDVLIDSTKTVDKAIGSNNETTVDVEIVDASQNWELDNVGNEYNATLAIDNSFNEETTEVDYDDWDVDANVIWDSNLAAIADDIDVDL